MLFLYICLYLISIHTLAWRVTCQELLVVVIADISIHTLAWRVTGNSMCYDNCSSNFNPHPRVEGDRYIWYLLLRNVAYIESYTTLFS